MKIPELRNAFVHLLQTKTIRIPMLTLGTLLGLQYFLLPEHLNYAHHGVFVLLLAFCLGGFFSHTERNRDSLLPNAKIVLFSFLLALSLTLGIYMDRGRSLETLGIFQMGLLGLRTLLITPFVERLLTWLSQILENRRDDVSPERSIRFFDWCIPFLIILLMWGIVHLAYWPGLFNYDAWQVDEVLHHAYSKHHPLLHTLFLGYCYRFGLEAGNPNLGIALYCLIQSILMAAILALAVAYLRVIRNHRMLSFLALLYFALFPAHPLMAISTTKDVLFSGFILLALLLALLFANKKNKTAGHLPVLLILVLSLIQLFRNNAQYAILLTAVCCLFQLRRSKWRKALLILLLSFGLFKGTDALLSHTLSAAPGEIAEALSIPIQMCGRIYTKLEKEDEDPEIREEIARYFDMTQAYYRPERSDLMKFYATISRDNVGDFLKLSLKLLVCYPLESADAALYLTEGLWNLQDVSYADVYRGISDRAGVMFTDIKPDYGIQLQSQIPSLERLYEHLFSENAYMKVPILAQLFSPALYTWLFLLLLVLGKDERKLPLLLPFAFLLLTIAAGPCIIVRYIYPFMLCAPVFLDMLCAGIQGSLRDHRKP